MRGRVGALLTCALFAGALAVQACGSDQGTSGSAGAAGVAQPGMAGAATAGAGQSSAGAAGKGVGGSTAVAGGAGAGGAVAAGAGGSSSTAGAGVAGDAPLEDPDFEVKFPPNKRRMLIRDEGKGELHYVNLANPAENWVAETTGWARGMQLVGNDVILGGRDDGYEEYDLKTGKILKTVETFDKTQSAYRMPNGETMLAQDGGDTVLSFLEPKTDVVKHKITYKGYSYIRMVRPTPQGTFLLPADNDLAEGDADGKILWTIHQPGWQHIWEALRLPDGRIVVGTAFGSTLDFLDPITHMTTAQFGGDKMPDANTIQPNFFAEFQILPNGNFITSNWQGHGDSNGGKGLQIVEFDPTGKVVWTYKQDPAVYSSIQGVMVLDGLDTQRLHVQSVNGMWTPVK